MEKKKNHSGIFLLLSGLVLVPAIYISIDRSGYKEIGVTDAIAYDAITTATNPNLVQLKTEVSQGVTIVGQRNRFHPLGNVTSFETSPTGEKVVAADRQVQIFDLQRGTLTQVTKDRTDIFTEVAWCADGEKIATFSTRGQSLLIYSVDELEEAPTEIPLKTIPGESSKHFHCTGLELSNHGKFIAAWNPNSLRVYDVHTGELVFKNVSLPLVFPPQFTDDEDHLIYSWQNKICLIDLKNGQIPSRTASFFAQRNGQSFAQNSKHDLAAIPTSEGIDIFQISTGKKLKQLSMPANTFAQTVTFSPDGSKLVASCAAQDVDARGVLVVLFSVKNGERLNHWRVATMSVDLKCRFASHQQELYVVGREFSPIETINLSEPPEEKLVAKLPTSSSQFVYADTEKGLLIAASYPKMTSWIDLKTGQPKRNLKRSHLMRIRPSSDGADLLSLSSFSLNNSIERFDLLSAEKKGNYLPVRSAPARSTFAKIVNILKEIPNDDLSERKFVIDAVMQDPNNIIHALYLDQTIRRVVATNQEQIDKCKLLLDSIDAKTGKTNRSVELPLDQFKLTKDSIVQSGTIKSSGEQLALANGNVVYIYSAKDGQVTTRTIGKPEHAAYIRYSPDDKFLIATSLSGVWIWNSIDGKLVFQNVEKHLPLTCFSQDSSRFATCNHQKESPVTIFDTVTWQPIQNGGPTQADRSCVSFSVNGKSLVFGLADSTFELWDLEAIRQ